jgi:allophanate hydrolase
MSGFPLNAQLTGLGAALVGTFMTSPSYRLFALANTDPPKPGLVRDPAFAGSGIEVEVWSLRPAAFGSFVAAQPAPMGIGRVTLADGTEVAGFMCERYALDGATEITAYGGWRAFRAQSA